jgi:cytoskeletal protein CcmA (bactofilin family)
MALWKDPTKSTTTTSFPPPDAAPTPVRSELPPFLDQNKADLAAVPRAPAPAAVREKAKSESLIAPDLTIEGKIEGTGHVRIAGRFKGDVDVRGDLTIESGAQVTGSIRAEKVAVAGDLIGNVESATHVDLLQSGSLTGDLKAATLTVAAGSRMRGQVDFGWEDAKSPEIVRHGAQRNGADHGNLS